MTGLVVSGPRHCYQNGGSDHDPAVVRQERAERVQGNMRVPTLCRNRPAETPHCDPATRGPSSSGPAKTQLEQDLELLVITPPPTALNARNFAQAWALSLGHVHNYVFMHVS